MSSLEYTIPPVILRFSDEQRGELRLYDYQAEARNLAVDHDACLMEVYAGTGMGKTAVGVLTAMEAGNGYAVFVYPTNELLVNQQESIREICRRMNLPMPELVTIYASDILSLMHEEQLRTRTDALLTRLFPRVDEGPKFVLTNPDTLHLILRLRYGGERRYGANAATILRHLESYTTLILDEFHSYERRELALLYQDLAFARFVRLFDKIVLMTATPHEGLRPYLSRLAEIGEMEHPSPVVCRAFSSGEASDGRTVVHKVRLRLEKQEDRQADLVEMRDYLVSLRERLRVLRAENPSEKYIPACVILNSVIDARTLTELLLEEFDHTEIGESHGLVPQSLRGGRGQALVLVGTSSIEVGIDFDTSYLLFQAWDAPSALQRYGRVGRHREGEAIFFAPAYVHAFFERYVTEIRSRDELAEVVSEAFVAADPGLWYLTSPIARIERDLLLDRLIRSIQTTPAAGSYADETTTRNYFAKLPTGDGRVEWEDVIRRAADSLVTLRASEPQVLVVDHAAQRRGLCPVYFSPLSRVLRRAARCRILPTDPQQALKPLYAIRNNAEDQALAETIDQLIHDYRLHHRAGRRVCVGHVFDYMRTRSRSIKMSYADTLPSSSSFDPVVGLNKEDLLGPVIGPAIEGGWLEEGESVVESLFLGRLYAIVDSDVYRQLGWGIESYPLQENRNARVFFDGGALVALAKYLTMGGS